MITRILTLSTALFFATVINAQDKPLSPAQKASGKIGEAMIEIEYNAPSVRDREVWGGLVPYDKVWRTGANEATRFTIDQPIMVEGETLAPGIYALFTIPGKDKWTVIFNKDPKQWGAYKYNADMDALRVEVKPSKGDFTEQMAFMVNDDNVSLHWEEVVVAFNVSSGF